MQRLFVGADGNLHVGIGLVKRKKLRQHLIVLDILAIDISGVTAQDLDLHDRRIGGLRLGNRRGEVYTNTFHVRLAQAHHHEAG